jgi:hypothetical protein
MSVQYVVDKAGRKTGVFLSIEEYEELLERAEDSEALEMLRDMKEKPISVRPFDEFLNEYSSHDKNSN